VRYARKYCCCLAPRAGSYTPSPSPRDHTAGKPAAGNKRQPRRVDRPREQAVTKPTSRLVETEPAYRSVVIIGSDRFARRAIPTKDPPRRHWIVRNRTSTWGNLSQLTNDTLPLPPPPPPPPLPSQTIVLARSPVDDDVGGRTVPAIVSQLEGRLNVAAQIHNSQPQLYIKWWRRDTKWRRRYLTTFLTFLDYQIFVQFFVKLHRLLAVSRYQRWINCYISR